LRFKASPRQIVSETLSGKTHHKERAGGMSQGVGPEFKLQYCKKQKKPIILKTYPYG
jgi:hypothetical protein